MRIEGQAGPERVARPAPELMVGMVGQWSDHGRPSRPSSMERMVMVGKAALYIGLPTIPFSARYEDYHQTIIPRDKLTITGPRDIFAISYHSAR